MNFKNLILLVIFLFITNCTTRNLLIDKENTTQKKGFSNKGFALIYSEDLYKQKIVSKKINERSLIIFQKNLKINSQVKITNILNNKTIIATVGKNSNYPLFNNSVLSLRVAEELDLNLDQPYIEIVEILNNSSFVAKKAKTYDEEKNVAIKAPVNSISINDLNVVQIKEQKSSIARFSYIIKVADFYYNDTALLMLNKINKESLIKDPRIEKISNKIFRVYLGPFDNISSLQKSYNDISILEFENIEIIQND